MLFPLSACLIKQKQNTNSKKGLVSRPTCPLFRTFSEASKKLLGRISSAKQVSFPPLPFPGTGGQLPVGGRTAPFVADAHASSPLA